MMNRTLNKSKWPYLLFLILCMVAASINIEAQSEPNHELPLQVSVQTQAQLDEFTPPSDWIVEFSNSGETQ